MSGSARWTDLNSDLGRTASRHVCSPRQVTFASGSGRQMLGCAPSERSVQFLTSFVRGQGFGMEKKT
jgi:hypothetical protein